MKIKMINDYQQLKKGETYDLVEHSAKTVLASGNAIDATAPAAKATADKKTAGKK